METGDERYVWICRWEEFQHYRPERDRGPAWIKDYTKQMLDDRYLRLSDRQRALIRDLRDVFAMNLGRLSDDSRTISRHRHRQTRQADLDALNHAGLIEVISRATLEHRLELLYSSPRARVEVDLEVEVEPPLPPADAGGSDPHREDQEPAQPTLLDATVPAPEPSPEERHRIAEQIRAQFAALATPNGADPSEDWVADEADELT